MSTDQTAAQFSRARVALQRLLQRVKDAVPTSARETLVEALCDGLRSIPVPLVGSFLARIAEEAGLQRRKLVIAPTMAPSGASMRCHAAWT